MENAEMKQAILNYNIRCLLTHFFCVYYMQGFPNCNLVPRQRYYSL